MSKPQSWRSWLLMPLLLILLTLALCEALLRFYFHLAPPKNYQLIAPDKAMLHFFETDPSEKNAYFSIKPNFDQDFVNHEFQVSVHTNNVGFRENSDYHGEPVDIAFIGDSFTFGWGVEADERYSDVVASAYPDQRTLIYTYPNGHAPINYLAFLQNHPELMPRVLVLGLFAYNDLAEDTADAIIERDPGTGRILRVGSKSLAITEDGYVYGKGQAPPSPWSWQGLLRRTAIGRTLLVAQQELSAAGNPPVKPSALRALDAGQFDETAHLALGHIKEIAEMANEHGTTLIVFYIPFASHVGDYPVCQYAADTCELQRQSNALGESLALWAEEQNIHFVDPIDHFRKLEADGQRLFFEFDAHWTVAGHAAAGQMIIEYLRENQILD